ncbi:MAG: hypothetical protein APF82_02015 [Sphingomonadales bacterium BRH_c42]|nr:MAG: hypothetical protein APF82_02015 [Sphingomonadales bacterium BRH_c42]
MKLSNSQRVKLIKIIAEHLEGEEWTSLDLTLKQFGFPVSDQWSGDKNSYVIHMIEDGNDDELVELAQHYGINQAGADVASPEPETPYWADGHLRVFISHLTGERELAAHIQTSLSRYGMSSFVAHNDIHPTLEWQTEIETALATCDLLVALIHPDFGASKWCDQEVGYALGKGIPVFAVRCGADPHGFVSRFQAFNGNGKSAPQIAKELFEAAIDHKKLQQKMADIVIDLFVNSGSFATAKERMTYVERLKSWDESYSPRLKKAVKTNSQVSGSWGVPEQVKAIIEKWK